MERSRLLFCSLLPSYFGQRQEDVTLQKLVQEYAEGYADIYELKLLLGSAHPATLEQAEAVLGHYKVPVQYLHVPFQMRPNFNARRAHEIGFSKQYLLRQLIPESFDFLMNIDSDVYMHFADYDKLIRLLKHPRQFINIPYVLHRKHHCGPIQLGAYIHSAELLKKINYSGAVYRTRKRKGKVVRRLAPDCAARFYLLRHGAKEIRAHKKVVSIATRHYSGKGVYGLYEAGAVTRHWNAEGWIGFDPVISPQAMDLSCCAALAYFARANRIGSAVVLGAGQGNAIGALAAADVREVVAISDESEPNRSAQRVLEQFSGTPIHAQQVERMSDGSGAYDLRAFRARMFDLAVIDDVSQPIAGRVASAMQIDARHYIFHAGEHDGVAIRQFAHRMQSNGTVCTVARLPGRLGLLLISLQSASERALPLGDPIRASRDGISL